MAHPRRAPRGAQTIAQTQDQAVGERRSPVGGFFFFKKKKKQKKKKNPKVPPHQKKKKKKKKKTQSPFRHW
jgi:hypothetical protein